MTSQLILPAQRGQIINVPREVWTAGSASRAAALGRLAPQVEAIASRGAQLARNQPSLLRRVSRLPGTGVLAPLLFLEAVEWASEWLRDSLIPSLRDWSRPTTTGTFRLGYRFSIEYLDYGVQGYPRGTPVVETDTVEVLPSSGIGSIISIDTPPSYRERPGFGSVGWEFVGNVTKQGGLPASEQAFSNFRAKSRYRFSRVLDWQVLGIPGTVPTARELYDPESGVNPNFPAQPGIAPAVPLDLPPLAPGLPPLPGDLTLWTPRVRGLPGERYDLDWVPRRQNRPDLQRFPGLRVGFRPWGVFIAELALDALLDELLDPSDPSGGGDCPDPCPDPCPEVDWEQVRPIIQEELDSKFPPARPNSEDSTTYAASGSHDIILPSFPRRARVLVSQAPDNRRYQPGLGEAPDVFYNGWYCVSRGGSGGDRKPIHYDEQWINLEPGDKRLQITLYVGTLATVQVFYTRED